MTGLTARRAAAAALAALALSALTACKAVEPEKANADDKPKATHSAKATDTPSATPTETATPSDAATPESTDTLNEAADGTALAALAALPVKGRAPMTGYDRDQFGQAWSDAAGDSEWTRDGCDTRNNALARDLQRETVESNGCVVANGYLAVEPYSGVKNYYFDKAQGGYGVLEDFGDATTDHPGLLDGEHLVSLGNAWVTGAQQLSADQRAALGNDPLNVIMVDASLNRAKGDADFATWLPPNKAFRCSYAARQIRVKAKYGLWVTAPEKAAMERVLATCPDEPLDQPDVQDGYTVGNVEAPDPSPAGTPSATPTKKPNPKPTGGSAGGDVYYENCDAVRAAGAAPIHVGDPGYGSHLDRDGDGAACE